jgi:uncharacterized integral membrane protein
MRQLQWFVGVVLLLTALVASAVFVLGNAEEVQIDLPFAEPFYQPLWLVVAVAFFGGAFAASAGLLFQLGRKTLAARRLEKRARGLEAEIEKLRAASASIAVGDGAPPVQQAP